MRRLHPVLFLIIIVTVMTSCSKKPVTITLSPTVTSTPVASPAEKAITISNGKGSIVWMIKEQKDGYVVSDCAGEPVATVTVGENSIEVKDKKNRAVCTLKKHGHDCTMESSPGKRYYISGGQHRGITILDGDRNLRYRIARNAENRMTISGDVSRMVLIKNNGAAIIDGSGSTLFTVTGIKQDACFIGLTGLEPLQRIAVMVFYMKYHGRNGE